MSESAGWEYARKLIAAEKVARTGTLDLGSLGLTDLPEELFELGHLEQLNLGSFWFDSDGKYQHSKNHLGQNSIETDLAEFKRLPNLRDLFLNSCILNTLTPLAGLTQLQSLYCCNTQVSDLTPLAGLTQLQ